jgi:CDP-glucose 4,6-dehydratase
MTGGFWKNKKVFVTGFEGFLGSHLSRALIALGVKLVGLDIRVGRKETILSPADYKKITVIKGSVADYKLVSRMINRHKINLVFHLAAEALVGKCHLDPLKAFSANIEGTWNILEACRRLPYVRSIVIASSDKAYGAHDQLPYREDAPLKGNHPYDVSKSCADLIADTYAHTYQLPVAVTRCGNIYGPGDFNFSRLIPDAMRCLAKGQTLKVRSDGKFIRDYVFVDDVCAGYLSLARQLESRHLAGESFNLSDESPLTVIGLLRQLNRFNLGKPKLKYTILNQAKYEIKKQYLSSAKARRVLGWRPVFSLADGLKITADWYFNYFAKR